ncbi:hypothetical protein PFISCL1PPCAC_28574, partial [Pristionchus fissidentatus]
TPAEASEAKRAAVNARRFMYTANETATEADRALANVEIKIKEKKESLEQVTETAKTLKQLHDGAVNKRLGQAGGLGWFYALIAVVVVGIIIAIIAFFLFKRYKKKKNAGVRPRPDPITPSLPETKVSVAANDNETGSNSKSGGLTASQQNEDKIRMAERDKKQRDAEIDAYLAEAAARQVRRAPTPEHRKRMEERDKKEEKMVAKLTMNMTESERNEFIRKRAYSTMITDSNGNLQEYGIKWDPTAFTPPKEIMKENARRAARGDNEQTTAAGPKKRESPLAPHVEGYAADETVYPENDNEQTTAAGPKKDKKRSKKSKTKAPKNEEHHCKRIALFQKHSGTGKGRKDDDSFGRTTGGDTGTSGGRSHGTSGGIDDDSNTTDRANRIQQIKLG